MEDRRYEPDDRRPIKSRNTRWAARIADKAGAGMLVAGTSVPVFPCHISGAYEAWPPEMNWPKRGSISVRIGVPLRFETLPNKKTG